MSTSSSSSDSSMAEVRLLARLCGPRESAEWPGISMYLTVADSHRSDCAGTNHHLCRAPWPAPPLVRRPSSDCPAGALLWS